MKTPFKILSFSFLALLAALAAGFFYYQSQLKSTNKAGFLRVESGDSLRKVAVNLEDQGLIKNALAFELLARLKGLSTSIKTGEYELKAGMDGPQILAKLLKGERRYQKLTIPEGYTFAQIAQLLEEAGIASAQEAKRAFNAPQYLKILDFEALSLEGYLFPDTYYYDPSTGLKEILSRMTQNFLERLKAKHFERLAELNWTVPQWVSLASIIQKESAGVEEMPLVSSVFHNRLKRGMLLQSDPTIIYGLKNFDGNIRKRDILNPHPYNTYQHPGLPPGPIANPGWEALEAALFPLQTEYLFFVSKRNGSHHFSKNYTEHRRAVNHYQIERKDTPFR